MAMQQNKSEELYDKLLKNVETKQPKNELTDFMQAIKQYMYASTIQSQAEELQKEFKKLMNNKQFIKQLAKSSDYARDLVAMIPPHIRKLIKNLEQTYREMGYPYVSLLGELESALSDKIQEEQHRLKEAERRTKKKAPLYRYQEYSEKQLIELAYRMEIEAKAHGQMPRNDKDVPNNKGWMMPFLFTYDSLFTGRWDYWREILLKGTVEGSGPIPQIEWCKDRNSIHQVSKMLQDCLNLVIPYGSTISEFADWLLWGLGCSDKPAKIPASVNKHWYETFDLALVLKYPTDYMSGLLEEATSHGHKQSLGYFATPIDITTLMHNLIFRDTDPEKTKLQAIYEPCAGCGAMLLPASNQTLFCAGQDINPVAVKLAQVQFMWYAPWYAKNPFSPDKLSLTKEELDARERLFHTTRG